MFKAQNNTIKQLGRHSLLMPEENDEITHMIINAQPERRPLSGRTRTQVSQIIFPIENSHLHATGQAIRDYFAILLENVSECPVHFFLNTHEMYPQTWADARSTICFFPSDHAAATIPDGQTRFSYRLHRRGREPRAALHSDLSQNL
jgi:hypothetical protein